MRGFAMQRPGEPVVKRRRRLMPMSMITIMLLGVVAVAAPASAQTSNTLVVERTSLGCNGSALIAFDPVTVEGGEVIEVIITSSPEGVLLDQTTLTLAAGEMVAEMFTVDNSRFREFNLIVLDAEFQGQPLAQRFAQCEGIEPLPPNPTLVEQLVAALKRVLSSILNR